MIFRLEEENGDPVMTLDEEGVDWLRDGLDQLVEQGEGEVTTPCFSEDGVGSFVIRLAGNE